MRVIDSKTSTALLVCGMQNDFCSNGGAFAAMGADLSDIHEMLPKASIVLTAARAAEIAILHLPELALPNGISDSAAWRAQWEINRWPPELALEGTWGQEFVTGFLPRQGELTAPRHRSGGLTDTRAPVLLRSAQVRRVIVMGVETHRAVIATAMQAAALDFHVIIPSDAVAGTDRTRSASALSVLESWACIIQSNELAQFLASTGQAGFLAAGDPR